MGASKKYTSGMVSYFGARWPPVIRYLVEGDTALLIERYRDYRVSWESRRVPSWTQWHANGPSRRYDRGSLDQPAHRPTYSVISNPLSPPVPRYGNWAVADWKSKKKSKTARYQIFLGFTSVILIIFFFFFLRNVYFISFFIILLSNIVD